MKKIQFIILITSCIFISCSEKSKINKNLEIDKIEVYYIPFHIASMMGGSIESIKELDKFIISDRIKLNSIKNELISLEKFKSDAKFTESSIHLLCDFYYQEKKIFTLFYDNLNLKVDKKFYHKNTDLLNLLISEANWHGNTPVSGSGKK